MVVKNRLPNNLSRTPVMLYTSGVVLIESKERNEFYYGLFSLILVYGHGRGGVDINGNA